MNEQKCVLHKLASEEDNLADLFQPENVLKKKIRMQHFLYLFKRSRAKVVE